MSMILGKADIEKMLELHLHKEVREEVDKLIVQAQKDIEKIMKDKVDQYALTILKHYSIYENADQIIITVKKDIKGV